MPSCGFLLCLFWAWATRAAVASRPSWVSLAWHWQSTTWDSRDKHFWLLRSLKEMAAGNEDVAHRHQHTCSKTNGTHTCSLTATSWRDNASRHVQNSSQRNWSKHTHEEVNTFLLVRSIVFHSSGLLYKTSHGSSAVQTQTRHCIKTTSNTRAKWNS